MPTNAIFSLIFLLSSSLFAQAQNFALNNNNLNLDIALITFKPSSNNANKYEKVSEGSPWLCKYWCNAFMTDAKGKTYNPMLIKIDLVADKLLRVPKWSS